VGNLTVGGTGKTPLVATIAEWLLSRGERPAILSRGYGRRARDVGVVVVSDGTGVKANLDMAGDEPIMLARDIPRAIVAVCEDRYLAGVLAERRLGATVHVLDDGFQHLALARDLDVLVTAPGEIGNGRVLPFGRLREPRDAAARAHVVVVMGGDAACARTEAWALGISQSLGATRGVGAAGAAGVVGAVLAVAGIGDPQQFFDGLRSTGCDVRGTRAFPDHHRYTRKDLDAIEQARRAVNAESILTTAKDLVRFEALGQLPFQVSAVPLSLQFDPPDVLFASIEAALARARNAA
jgi:tetraacyldisaccharide 4'-kinase